MAKKKSNKRPPTQPKQQPANAAPPAAKKMEPKARWLIALSVAVALASAGIILYSGNLTYGTLLYNQLQAASYIGLALAGGIIMYSTKYNHTSSRLNMQVVGIVFAMIGLGNVLWFVISGKV